MGLGFDLLTATAVRRVESRTCPIIALSDSISIFRASFSESDFGASTCAAGSCEESIESCICSVCWADSVGSADWIMGATGCAGDTSAISEFAIGSVSGLDSTSTGFTSEVSNGVDEVELGCSVFAGAGGVSIANGRSKVSSAIGVVDGSGFTDFGCTGLGSTVSAETDGKIDMLTVLFLGVGTESCLATGALAGAGVDGGVGVGAGVADLYSLNVVGTNSLLEMGFGELDVFSGGGAGIDCFGLEAIGLDSLVDSRIAGLGCGTSGRVTRLCPINPSKSAERSSIDGCLVDASVF